MAKKVDIPVHLVKGLPPETVTVYQEGPLFVYEDDSGWAVGHVATGRFCCDGERWKMKRDALEVLNSFLTSKIDWNFDQVEEFWEFNTPEEVQAAMERAINV